MTNCTLLSHKLQTPSNRMMGYSGRGGMSVPALGWLRLIHQSERQVAPFQPGLRGEVLVGECDQRLLVVDPIAHLSDAYPQRQNERLSGREMPLEIEHHQPLLVLDRL